MYVYVCVYMCVYLHTLVFKIMHVALKIII